MKKKWLLIIAILMFIITSVVIVGELFILDPSYLNLSYVCFTSVVGYSTALVYLITYLQNQKQTNG